MRQAILALATIGLATANEQPNMVQFMQYVGQHEKNYKSTEEFNLRLARWHTRDMVIKEHQKNATRNFDMGHNHLSDWMESEVKGMLGYRQNIRDPARLMRTSHINAELLPAAVDWRNHNAVTGVKNQGDCGSCWAFATSAILEGAHAVQSGQLLSFSEQLWVSCVKNQAAYGYISEVEPCCNGCSGGDYDASFSWAGNNSIFLILELNWRYLQANGTCEYESKGKTNIQVANYTDVPANNPTAMKEALSHQPVGVGIDGGEPPFQSYVAGVIDSTDCFVASNHAITAVGYGINASGLEFWIVKNSWGSTWGENGYARIAIVDGDGICGVQQSPSYATTMLG